MNKIISLTKVLLKNSFQKYSENNKKTSKAGKVILYGILIVYLMGIFGFLSYGLITTLQQVHQEAMFIGIFLLGLALLTIIQSIISATNVFYFSKDLDYILPLPLKPRENINFKIKCNISNRVCNGINICSSASNCLWNSYISKCDVLYSFFISINNISDNSNLNRNFYNNDNNEFFKRCKK